MDEIVIDDSVYRSANGSITRTGKPETITSEEYEKLLEEKDDEE